MKIKIRLGPSPCSLAIRAQRKCACARTRSPNISLNVGSISLRSSRTDRMISAVAFIAAFVALASAQAPTPCDAPPLFEATAFREFRDQGVREIVRFAYDEFHQRFREIKQVTQGNKTSYNDEIFLFNEGKKYSIDFDAKVCNVTALTNRFPALGIPQNATSRGEGYVGFAYEGVLISRWELASSDFFWMAEVTAPHCIPIRQFYKDKTIGRISTTYYDFTAGISDPNVFIPPSPLCK